MKKTLMIASIAALAFIAGCNNDKDTSGDGNMGVVGESKKGSCCTQKTEGEGSMGVVSDKKAGACESKKSCDTGATCPFSGKSDQKN